MARQLSGPGRKLALEVGAAELTTAAKSERASAGAFADLGAIQQMQGLSTQAVRSFSRVMELAPDEPQYRVDRGWSRDAQNLDGDAQADFLQALSLDRGHNEAMTGVGYVAAQQG